MATVLVFHAHPDDEAFTTAGWMLDAAAAGARVVNVIGTGGEASEMSSGSVDLVRARGRRIGKLERSLEVLGASSWEWLAGPGRWIDGDPVRYPTLGAEDTTVLASLIGESIIHHSPELILSVGTDGVTAHPDHQKIGRALSAAVRRVGRPHQGAWGARVRAIDVAAAHAHLKRATGLESVGSGRMTGTAEPLRLQALSASDGQLRREALDCYFSGLGTMPIDQLIAAYPSRGDSLLLRSVLDTTQWGAEHYTELGTDADPCPEIA